MDQPKETVWSDLMDKTEHSTTRFATNSFRPLNSEGVIRSFVPANGPGLGGWRFYTGQSQNVGPFRSGQWYR